MAMRATEAKFCSQCRLHATVGPPVLFGLKAANAAVQNAPAALAKCPGLRALQGLHLPTWSGIRNTVQRPPHQNEPKQRELGPKYHK